MYDIIVIGAGVTAVSYTHLDVYKRQAYKSWFQVCRWKESTFRKINWRSNRLI